MKFTVPAITLALLSSTFPLLTSAAPACNDCDEASLAQIGVCTHAWVDKIIYYCQNECKITEPQALLEQCEGDLTDTPLSDNSTTTTTIETTTKIETSTSTPTETVKTNSTTTTAAPKVTESDGAATPAFGGIGFGGGAAAMVGLAGLVGLVL